jgi:hypothetical protein
MDTALFPIDVALANIPTTVPATPAGAGTTAT